MATSARLAAGTLLQSDDGAGNYTTIAEVRTLKMTGPKVAAIDVSSHDTPTWMEKIVGLLDPGQVTFDLNWSAATTQGYATGIWNDMLNRTKRNFKIVVPTLVAKTFSFAAYILDMPHDLPQDGVMRVSVTLEITGSVSVA
jgi:predicted secreted protein